MSEREGTVYEAVYAIVRQIPEGRVTSYGRIAAMVERCTARMVGYAMAALSPGSEVPWQRVINAQGKISPRSGGPGAIIQRQILEEEGVEFSQAGIVDFDRFGWPD